MVEQINYSPLFRWFVGLAIEDSVWNHSVSSKNRHRLIEHDVVIKLFNRTVGMAQAKGLLSGEHFGVDGAQMKAWAGHKSVRRKDCSDNDRTPEDWRGERRSNDTHESKTDPDSAAVPQEQRGAGPAQLPWTRPHRHRHGLVVNVQGVPPGISAAVAIRPVATLNKELGGGCRLLGKDSLILRVF